MNTDVPATAGRLAACLLGVVLALAGSAAGAAAQGAGGTLEGTVQDDSGAVLPGVTVTVTSAASGRSRSVVTDSRGEYRMVGLAAGGYTVQGILPGFRTEAQAVTLGDGALAHDIVLGIAPLAETVHRHPHGPGARARAHLRHGRAARRDRGRAAPRVARRGAARHPRAVRAEPAQLRPVGRHRPEHPGAGAALRPARAGDSSLQDGIPITTADGTTEPGNVDLGSVGRIDVIRGPSSVLYGNSAGGVINLETTFDTSRRLTITPDIQFGSHGYNRQQVRLDGGNTGTQFMASISRFETDGFRQNAHAEITQANFVVRRELTADTEIRGIFNLYDAPFAQSPSFLNREDASTAPQRGADGDCIAGACLARGVAAARGWGEGASQGQGGVTLEHRFSDTQRFRATGWGMWRDLDAVGAFRNIELGRTGFGFRSEYVGAAEAGAATIDWAAGVDVATQNDDRMEFGQAGDGSSTDLRVDQTEDVMSAGPFAQIGIAPTDRVRFNRRRALELL